MKPGARSLLFTAIAVLVAAPVHVSGEVDRPNIVLIMCDDLGWGDWRGNNPKSPVETPHLDAMAEAGLTFTRFYSASSVCSPTRASCLTGRNPFRVNIPGANSGRLPEEEITLPELLRDAGYTTGHFGKWHLGTLTTEVRDANRGRPGETRFYAPPSAHGYDDAFVTESKVPTYDPMVAPPKAPRTAWDPLTEGEETVAYGTRYWDIEGREVTGNLEGDDSRIIVDRALPFMERAVTEGLPFLAVVWFHAPHLPVVAGADDQALYPGTDLYERNYFGCISALDREVGRIRANLREWGVAEDTMVWFCSDNGPEGKAGSAPGSAAILRGRKRDLYEGGIRVPGILEWPRRVEAGSVTSFAAFTSDYLPTIVDFLGLTYPDDRPIDGISLRSVIEEGASVRPAPMGFLYRSRAAWTEQRFKLYRDKPGQDWQLYDLAEDPSEKNDLADRQPQRVEAMSADFAEWRESVERSRRGDDYPDGDTN